MSVPFVYVNGTINLVLKGQVVQITSNHPVYGLIKKSLATATEAELLKMIDVNMTVQSFVEKETDGKAIVKNGIVYFNNKEVHNVIAKRILQFIQEGLPFRHLLKFMENVALNPSYTSQQELFDFLENKGLPITEDGEFLAYKAVDKNYMDKYSRTINNAIGNTISIDRGNVDDDRTNECSKGLHCGALDYVYGYSNRVNDHIIIVKVHPKDVVSVPKDSNFQKLRCCKYIVVKEFEGEMNKPLYTQEAKEVSSPNNDYDWSFADDNVTAKDVCVNCSCKNKVKFHNKRDSKGRFTR